MQHDRRANAQNSPQGISAAGQARRDLAHAALLLLASLAIFFWPAVLGGRVLLPADVIFDLDPLWQPLAPDGYTQPSNHILSDQVYQFHPWRIYTLRSLAQGRLPLWNPYAYSGQPFVGNAQSAILDPFNLLSYLFPRDASYAVTVIARLFTAGIFAFLFAREVGLSKPGALLAMMAFTFSGSMIGWVGYPLASVIAWFPAMLFTIERALARASSRYVIASGLAIGAQFLGGHPETSWLVVLVWIACALCRAVALEGRHLSTLLPQLVRIAAAVALGCALGAVQLLPFVESLLQSAVLASRQSRAVSSAPALLRQLLFDWHNWPTAITTLLPLYFGTPLHENYLYPFSNYVDQNTYAGVLPLALALSVTWHALRNRSWVHRGTVLWSASLALIALGIALHLPLLNLVNRLPLFRISANERLRLVYVFALSILAGMGLDQLIDGQRRDRLRLLRVLILLALISLLTIALTYAGLALFRDRIIAYGRAFVASRWGTPHFPRPLEHYYALVEERYDRTLAQFLPTHVVMYLPVLVPCAWLIAYRLRQQRDAPQVWTLVALGLTALDLFITGMPFNPTTAPEELFPVPGAIRFLQQDPDLYRVCGTGTILNPNSSTIFGISDIRGYDAIAPRRYADLVARMEGHFGISHYTLFSKANAPLLGLLNVKYVLTEQDPGAGWALAYQDAGPVRVYQNLNVLPRAFVVYQADIVGSAQASLARVTDSGFDFRRRVVLEQDPPGWSAPIELPTAGAEVTIAAYEAGRVRLTVDTRVKGLLVLTDTYMPGWRATIDGQATGIYVANHAFRAIVIPAGSHQVEFVYAPSSFWGGAAISLTAALATLATLLVLRVKRIRDI